MPRVVGEVDRNCGFDFREALEILLQLLGTETEDVREALFVQEVVVVDFRASSLPYAVSLKIAVDIIIKIVEVNTVGGKWNNYLGL